MFIEFECKRVKDIWKSIEHDISKSIKVSIILSPFGIVFGYLLKNQHKTPINAIILITKKFIYDAVSKTTTGSSFNLHILKHRFQQTYQDEMYLATTGEKHWTSCGVLGLLC